MNHHQPPMPAPRRPRPGPAVCAAALLVATAAVAQTAPAGARAAGAGSAPDNAQLEQVARDWLQPALATAMGQAATTDAPLRAEVALGTLDARLRLAPCARIEPHLPPGGRLWGRSRIGLRCVDGPTRWNVFLPVTVQAWGPAWVLKRPVDAGAILATEDAELAEVDWAAQHASVLANPALWVGQQAAYPLQPGQALRQNMVRPVPLFGAGAPVRVSSSGSGFEVVVTGEALSAGLAGQSARVRLPGGKVVTGLVRDAQTVEVGL